MKRLLQSTIAINIWQMGGGQVAWVKESDIVRRFSDFPEGIVAVALGAMTQKGELLRAKFDGGHIYSLSVHPNGHSGGSSEIIMEAS